MARDVLQILQFSTATSEIRQFLKRHHKCELNATRRLPSQRRWKSNIHFAPTMSSRVREVEHTGASQCEYVTATSYVSKSTSEDGGAAAWCEPADPPTDAAEAAAATTPTVRLQEGTTLRVAPMDRKCGGWDYEHFHDKLRLADGCNAGRGMVVTLEGEPNTSCVFLRHLVVSAVRRIELNESWH